MVEKDDTAAERNFRKGLEEINRELGLVGSGIVVVAAALKSQESGLDLDMAVVLDCSVGSLLFKQMDRLAGLIDSLKPSPRNELATLSLPWERSTARPTW